MVRPLSARLVVGSMDVPDAYVGLNAPQQGTVVDRGLRVKKVEVGARVLFGYGVGHDLHWQGEGLLFIDEKDVICELS